MPRFLSDSLDHHRFMQGKRTPWARPMRTLTATAAAMPPKAAAAGVARVRREEATVARPRTRREPRDSARRPPGI